MNRTGRRHRRNLGFNCPDFRRSDFILGTERIWQTGDVLPISGCRVRRVR